MKLATFVLCLSLVLTFLGTYPSLGAQPASVAGSACAHVLKPASSTAGPTVECFVNATGSLTFEPNSLFVPANSTVVFSVDNVGSLPHTFTLDSLANDSTLAGWMASPSSVSPGDLTAHFANRSAVDLNLPNAGTVSSSPVSLHPGHGIFYFVCLIGGHFQQGMFGSLYMGIAVPPPVVMPSQGSILQQALLGTAFGVIALAAVLLLVAALRGPKVAVRGARPAPAWAEGNDPSATSSRL